MITDVEGIENYFSCKEISFMKGMSANLYLRPSCYECQFKGIERKTDITLGDYWGVWDIQPELDDDKGISLVLIHTDKGKKLFDEISNQLVYCTADLNQAVKRNSCIMKSVNPTNKRNEFFKQIGEEMDFDSVIDSLTRLSFAETAKKNGKKLINKFIGNSRNI